jgi:alpha-amylase
MLSEKTWNAIESERFLPKAESIKVLLKNYRLSDDVAFRFSDRTWVGFPLTADTFCDWLSNTGGESINLFMDYETFGEHQWEDSGIFNFLEALPGAWERKGGTFATPSEVIEGYNGYVDTLDVHAPMSWADIERDLSAWQGNRIQDAALQSLFAVEDAIKEMNDPELTKDWRKLTTSDHFYYMCTKYWSDGDVHKYFSPYDSPYEAYRRFSHAVAHVKKRAEKVPVVREAEESDEAEESMFQKFLGIFGLFGIQKKKNSFLKTNP